MNSPKEKAKELVSKMVDTYNVTSDFCYDSTAKQCAIIAVDEIIKETDTYYDTIIASERKLYWRQVKTEIENL